MVPQITYKESSRGLQERFKKLHHTCILRKPTPANANQSHTKVYLNTPKSLLNLHFDTNTASGDISHISQYKSLYKAPNASS